ncbi:MAG TPA: glycosyltransferase family 1 protein [Methylomusa anaerophila]|uniref:GDP-mannose-dependent alpha-mannosyltransferase n=1 Tax=Methylomusa anaerophila TaxID=1930071 RepID=A0A348ALY7_9FIRM|nr:glycosyltransferase family 1 protein [Methylomusa anaerophila]BBB92085.1 GDP-mannose-dependent alpha-mannosyltransferase [Methylomusa anaerophila]HML87902.1 glycosyltransferase family 1 protein [Methylomusa anaerophila]
MRIVLFTDTFTPQINGVAKTYQRLLAYLQSKNIETLVYAPTAKSQEPSVTNSNGVCRVASLDFFLYRDCQISLPNYFAVRQTLDKYKPDLVHLATPFSLGLTGLKYATQRCLPKVAVFHTNFPQYLEHWRVPQLKKLAWRFLRWFHRQAERNYCPSRDTMRMMRLQGINNVELWTRGVDQNIFNPDFRSLDFRRSLGIDDKIVLLYVGRLAPEKSVDVLLRALDKANKKCDNLHLLLIGDGPSRHYLTSIAPENVTFMGYRSGNDLSTAYASADIFVCPSITETFGNVILEAMASSLPVIAPLAGGIKENLFPMRTGIPCTQLNHESMAAGMERLAIDSQLRSSLALGAYEHAKSQSWNEVFFRLVNSYHNVVELSPKHSFSAAQDKKRKTPGCSSQYQKV